MVRKRVDLCGIVLLIVLLSSVLVFGAIITIVDTSSLSTAITINDNINNLFNLTVLNESATIGALENVTEINVTLPGNLVFTSGTNRTGNFDSQVVFSNSSNVLTLRNTSGFLLNTTNSSAFSFNTTGGSPGVYNMSITIVNSTGGYIPANISLTINDTTAPNVSLITVSNTNYSGTFVFNVSVMDNQGDNDNGLGGKDGKGVSLVNITIYNATDATSFNQSLTASNVTGGYWNISINTSQYTDGVYNISVWTNDTNGNLNNSVTASNIRFDNTAPDATFSCTPNPANNGDVVTCTCDPADDTSGVNESQTDFTVNPSTITNGDTTLTCTFADGAGNTGSTTTTLTVSSPSGGGSSGAVINTPEYTKTFGLDNIQLKEHGIISQQLKIKERVRVKIDNGIHHIGVKELDTTSATVEISSDPVRISLDIGEDAKVNVNNDNYYDVYVKLNSIENNKADLTINYLHEMIENIEEDGNVETTGEIVDENNAAPVQEDSGNQVWIWAIVIAVVIILVFWIISKRK